MSMRVAVVAVVVMALFEALGKVAFVAALAAVAIAAMVSLSGCEVDASTARRVLESQGFSDVRMTGYAFFACGSGDDFASSFRAKNARGAVVEGVVCCGVFKSCTVRF